MKQAILHNLQAQAAFARTVTAALESGSTGPALADVRAALGGVEAAAAELKGDQLVAPEPDADLDGAAVAVNEPEKPPTPALPSGRSSGSKD